MPRIPEAKPIKTLQIADQSASSKLAKESLFGRKFEPKLMDPLFSVKISHFFKLDHNQINQKVFHRCAKGPCTLEPLLDLYNFSRVLWRSDREKM